MKTELTLLCCACMSFPQAKAQSNHEKKPNIIILMGDQHRSDCVGAMGNKVIKTPNLDALSRDGLLFMNGYSSTPSCTPARATLLTGMSAWKNGMLGYGALALKYQYEMPVMLKQKGYYTYSIGKLHYAPQRNLHGFDGAELDESGRVQSPEFISDYRKWFKETAPGLDPDSTGIGWNEHTGKVYALDEKLHPTTWTSNQAIKFIDGYNSDQPLLLNISFARPHSPYDPPQRFFDLYKDANVAFPFIGDWCARFADSPWKKDATYGNFGEDHAIESRKFYYGSISFVDEKIGEIIAELKKKGMYENSLIIYISDHGDMLGDHYHWRKTYAYEGSSHIPFIIKFPKNLKGDYPKGSTLEQTVELRDILPTFLDVAGIPVPKEMDGQSLYSLYRNKNTKWREYIDLEHAGPDNWFALTDGKMKYIWYNRSGEEQLFDISSNKTEAVNLAKKPEYTSMLELWRNRLIRHLQIRGEKFVKDGQLQINTGEGMLYSPNYPGTVPNSKNIESKPKR